MNSRLLKNKNFVNIAISYYFLMISFNSNIRALIPDALWFFIEVFFYLLFIAAFWQNRKRIRRSIFMFFFAFFTIFAFSFFIATEKSVHYYLVSFLFRWGFPLLFLGFFIYDWKNLFNNLKTVAFISCLISISGIFILRTNVSVTAAYSQDTGYQSLIPFVILCIDFFMNKNKISLLFSLMPLFTMVMGGARGPLLAFAISFLLIILFGTKVSYKKIITIVLISAGIFVFYFVFFDSTIDLLIDFFEEKGLSVRVLQGLKEGTIGADDSRSQLSSFAFNYSTNHLFYGTGIINDRVLLYSNLTVDSNKTIFGYYCHNIFLEVMMQFGLIPGIILLLVFFVLIIKRFCLCKNQYEKGIMLLLLSIGIFPLLVSYSYLSYAYFYLFFGFVTSKIFIKKRYVNIVSNRNNGQTVFQSNLFYY